MSFLDYFRKKFGIKGYLLFLSAYVASNISLINFRTIFPEKYKHLLSRGVAPSYLYPKRISLAAMCKADCRKAQWKQGDQAGDSHKGSR
jgi:hypothetical protein